MEFNSHILFESQAVKIGTWRCGPKSRLWFEENVTGDQPMLVFPRTSVQIRQETDSATVTTRNHLVFYNKHQAYQRRLVDPRGDYCEFYYICPAVLAWAFEESGVPLPADPDRPFQTGFGYCDPRSYSIQSLLYQYLVKNKNPSKLFTEETFFSLLARLLEARRSLEPKRSGLRKSTETKRRELVEAAKEFLVRNLESSISIHCIADACDCSAFHLCRVFKEQTGCTVFKYFSRLRLLEVLERVLESPNDLLGLAMRFGFSSHSHMTQQFRQLFGTTPSELRRLPCQRSIRELLTNRS